MENKLPPYWIVKNDGSQEFKDTVIKYLNEVHNEDWTGNTFRHYYGYDGDDDFNGTNMCSDIEFFQNNPTLLTIKQFKEMTTQERLINGGYKEYKPKEMKVKFKLGEQIAVSDASKEEAINKLETREYEYYYTGGIDVNGYHITQDSVQDFVAYKYIAKIPKPKTIKIKDINGNECQIEENKILDLGFTKK